MRFRWAAPLGISALLFATALSSQAITIADVELPGDTTLQILTGSFSWDVLVTGTTEATDTTYPFIGYVVGQDIYENETYLPVTSGTVTVRGAIIETDPVTGNPVARPATSAPINGRYFIPNDGTLHNITSGYVFKIEIYTPGFAPTDVTELGTSLAVPVQTSGLLTIDVLPDLDVSSPGVTYRAGAYSGGDIIPFIVSWRNDLDGEKPRESRPLTASDSDRYSSDLRLSMNAEFDDEANNDFLLSRRNWSGDVTSIIPDGTSVLRNVEVSNTPGAIPPHGLTGIGGTERNYTPQPDDGFLDIGEEVSVELEALIPDNYYGYQSGYFVAVRVAMNDPDEDVDDNNTFVSNSADKISIQPSTSPSLEAASVISTQAGAFVESGNAPSDFGSVSEDGNITAFSSQANNLLDLPSGSAGLPTSYQQIFIKYRHSRVVELVSINGSTGRQANKDCFHPMISADGTQVAFESLATNLVDVETFDRSLIYVYNIPKASTVLVSKSAAGFAANGDCFKPRLSRSGRFVSFESMARNLDPARPLPSSNRSKQVYLHDRDIDGNGVFDEVGGTETYLVSINEAGIPANGRCNNAVVNLDDTQADLATLGGVFVAYSSYARNMPLGTGYSMIYRVTVTPGSGPDPSSVVPVSVNDLGAAPVAVGVDPVGTFIRPDCDEAAINGDGTQIAFTSYASNFVYNETDDTYIPTYPNNDPADPSAAVDPDVVPAGDYNRVPDIFVRNFQKTQGANSGATARVSVSEPRVATGTITFYPDSIEGNIPENQPSEGEQLTISDGINPSVTLLFGTDVIIGDTVYETRNNLVAAINTAGLELLARATTPPNSGDPGTAFGPSIYVRNLVPGAHGNVAMTTDSVVLESGLNGMSGGGIQAEEDALSPGNTEAPPIQGVPFGSNQPSIDSSGRFVAFRSTATNLDVYTATDLNTFPGSPATGELIRPLIFPTSNVYLHDRLADENPATGFDEPGNQTTRRVSVNRFGYKTLIDGSQTEGVGATTTANSSRPWISGNGRFVAFSSDSSGEGGLIFGPNNLTPLDNTNLRDVFVSDQQTVGDNPPTPATEPRVTIQSPFDGAVVVPGTTLDVAATATPTGRRSIVSATCIVNGTTDLGTLTNTPFAWSFVADPAGTYVIEVTAVDSRGEEGASYVQITASQPTVPPNPPAGSNEKFVVDYFTKIFLRSPSYDEYEFYLNMLDGSSQAETVVAMMQSPEYAAAENILFGYYLRMGLTPQSTNAVKTYLYTMTNGTNASLLTNSFIPMSPYAGVPPYGATIGQASVAQSLLGLVNAAGTNKAVRSMTTSSEFRSWMLRSFNEPYLTQNYTNTIYSMGSQGAMTTNIQTVPSQTSSALSRYGHNYAYMSAFYASMPPENMAGNNLKSSLTNFNDTIQGIALNYLITSGNPWATNTAPLSTNLAASLLPPVITNTGTNTLTISNNFTDTVGGQNLLPQTVYSYTATNLPATVTVSTNSGSMVISGQFTNVGTYPVTFIASNGPGLVGSNRVVYSVAPAAPIVRPRTIRGSVGAILSDTVTAENSPTSFSVDALPAGLNFNTASGVLLGVPLESGLTETTLTASNAGGTSQSSLTFEIEPASSMVDWLIQHGLAADDAKPESDPDADGHSNVVEFAFGMRPDVADNIPTTHIFEEGGTTIRWTRRIKTSEVTYQIEESPSLQVPAWTAVSGLSPQVVAAESGVVLPLGYERVSAFIPRPSGHGAPASMFYRVKAEPAAWAIEGP